MKRYDGKNAWWFLLIIILYNLIPIITLFLFKDFSNGFILTISYIFYYSFDFLLSLIHIYHRHRTMIDRETILTALLTIRYFSLMLQILHYQRTAARITKFHNITSRVLLYHVSC